MEQIWPGTPTAHSNFIIQRYTESMNIRRLGQLIVAIEVIILVGVTIHAPLTVWLGTQFPAHIDLIKSWKELLMGLCLILLAVYLTLVKKWPEVQKDLLIRLAAAYAALHVILLAWMPQGVMAAGSGLMIDLRYILFFVLVYASVRYIAGSRRVFLIGAGVGSIIVIGFAALQLTVLPDDVLAHIGYSKQTIAPYLTVDLNHEYVRINSTLRGPNPVGAYAGMCLALTLAYVVSRRQKMISREKVVAGLLALGSIAALWASYSRSAVVAGIGMAGVVALASQTKRISRNWWIAGVVVTLGLFGGLIAARDTAFVSNVIMHENPSGGSVEKSNDGHVESLQDGMNRFVKQPLGGGIGSTGSASLRSESPLIIENQYLFIAHEVGWFGVALFAALFGVVMMGLWRRRQDWLALGLFASGLGIACIGLLLPVWADDTVSIVWWGLVGVALATGKVRHGKKRTSH